MTIWHQAWVLELIHTTIWRLTIPLEGALAHKDSMGNEAVIYSGYIQIMSAGTGVEHSEYNHSSTNSVKLLQIWVFPKEKNIPPRYRQLQIDDYLKENELVK